MTNNQIMYIRLYLRTEILIKYPLFIPPYNGIFMLIFFE